MIFFINFSQNYLVIIFSIYKLFFQNRIFSDYKIFSLLKFFSTRKFWSIFRNKNDSLCKKWFAFWYGSILIMLCSGLLVSRRLGPRQGPPPRARRVSGSRGRWRQRGESRAEEFKRFRYESVSESPLAEFFHSEY